MDPRTRSRYIPLLIKKPDIDIQLLIRFASFWVTCVDSDNPKIRLATKLSLDSSSPIADNLRQIMAILQCDYGNLCSFMREKRMIKDMILAKCTDMNVPEDTATVSIVLQLCLQRENHIVMPLQCEEVEQMLTIIYTELNFNCTH